jgi:hypothetical protein
LIKELSLCKWRNQPYKDEDDYIEVFKEDWTNIIDLCATYQDDCISELKIKANARLSSAMAQSKLAKSAVYEAMQEGRIRELHWLIDELDPPKKD